MAYNIVQKLKLLSLFESIHNVYVRYGYIELIQINYLSGSNHEGTLFSFHTLYIKEHAYIQQIYHYQYIFFLFPIVIQET